MLCTFMELIEELIDICTTLKVVTSKLNEVENVTE